MKNIFLALVLLCANAFGVYKVGDTVADSCYETLGGGNFCLSHASGMPKVIINNAGWCPPCNSEMKSLGQTAHSEFNPLAVAFISLSAEGYQRGTKPDQTFLKSWQEKHNIPFIVAGDFKNFGKEYFSSPAIPNVAVLDGDNKLVWKAIGPDVSEIYEKVHELLGD